ncbi:MAG: hypothetical protein WKF94_08930 [Solirubrobacteraceae bacterium]
MLARFVHFNMKSFARVLGVLALGALAYLCGTWLAELTPTTALLMLALALVGLVFGAVAFRARRRALAGPPPPGAASDVLSSLRLRPRGQAAAPQVAVKTAAPALSPKPNR